MSSYIKNKGNTGMRTRISMSFKKYNDCQKDNLCAVSHICKKTVANDRAGIKHLTLKFRGPVCLGGMNKWWKNELLKEHWPKICIAHLMSWWSITAAGINQEESVKKRGGPSYSKNMWGREDEGTLHRLLYCLGKSPGQNGIIHSHWTKYINSKTQLQNDSRTK